MIPERDTYRVPRTPETPDVVVVLRDQCPLVQELESQDGVYIAGVFYASNLQDTSSLGYLRIAPTEPIFTAEELNDFSMKVLSNRDTKFSIAKPILGRCAGQEGVELGYAFVPIIPGAKRGLWVITYPEAGIARLVSKVDELEQMGQNVQNGEYWEGLRYRFEPWQMQALKNRS
jgi:hypothetical protein